MAIVSPELLLDHDKTLGHTNRDLQIQKYPIDGQEYDFSFSVTNNWENPVPVTANRANVQTQYRPTQRINKSFLAECYLLQDCWADDPDCIRHIYSNVILDSWESDGIYITDILDPRNTLYGLLCDSTSHRNH